MNWLLTNSKLKILPNLKMFVISNNNISCGGGMHARWSLRMRNRDSFAGVWDWESASRLSSVAQKPRFEVLPIRPLSLFVVISTRTPLPAFVLRLIEINRIFIIIFLLWQVEYAYMFMVFFYWKKFRSTLNMVSGTSQVYKDFFNVEGGSWLLKTNRASRFCDSKQI